MQNLSEGRAGSSSRGVSCGQQIESESKLNWLRTTRNVFSVIKNLCTRTPEIINCRLFHSLFNTAHGTNPIPRDSMMHCINDNLLIEWRKLFATLGAEKVGLRSSALMKQSKQNYTWTNHLMEFSSHSCRRHKNFMKRLFNEHLWTKAGIFFS